MEWALNPLCAPIAFQWEPVLCPGGGGGNLAHGENSGVLKYFPWLHLEK